MNLDLLEKTQLITLVWNKIYKQKTTQYNNHKVRNKCFNVGEPSSLEKTRGNRKPRGRKKLAPKRDNPYKIVYMIDAKTYHLLNTIRKNLACA